MYLPVSLSINKYSNIAATGNIQLARLSRKDHDGLVTLLIAIVHMRTIELIHSFFYFNLRTKCTSMEQTQNSCANVQGCRIGAAIVSMTNGIGFPVVLTN